MALSGRPGAIHPGRIDIVPFCVLGGFAGGVLGLRIFFRFRRPDVDAEIRLRYLDVIAYVFPFAWVIGRLACTVAHDHPGRITNSPPTWPGGNGKVNPPGNIGHRRG